MPRLSPAETEKALDEIERVTSRARHHRGKTYSIIGSLEACRRKHPFIQQDTAQLVAARMMTKGTGKAQVYKCQACRHYHIASGT